MRYTSIIFCMFFCFQVAIADDLSAQQECEILGDYAAQASQLRLDGVDMASANAALLSDLHANHSTLDDRKLSGAVQVSYMAKMKPKDMRAYYMSQCQQDIVR